ncbi:Coronatine-insensitive protein [Sarracenia purpurea var. burkii]
MMDLVKVRFQDLELIARNCRSLVSVKISECELLDLAGFFSAAAALEEFGGGSFGEQPERYSSLSLPPKVRCLGLTYLGRNEMPIVFPFASLLRRLDLLHTLLDTEDHCHLIQRCPNLEVLEYSPNVRWMLLSSVGESDAGLLEFSRGCPRLQKLEIGDCSFSERALAMAALQLTSLRYMWVQGYRASSTALDLFAMARPFWNIELIPARRVVVSDPLEEAVIVENPAHILAYCSLAGQRTDFPDTVIPLDAAAVLNA